MSADREAKLKKYKEDRNAKLEAYKKDRADKLEAYKKERADKLEAYKKERADKLEAFKKEREAKLKKYRENKKTGGKVMKRAGGGMLKGNQKKLDADGSGTITANDFQKLRNRDKMVSKKYGGRMMKRAGGGMTYQLYGGSSKNIHDGNTEISQFYDTKN